ncbi:gliding motility-associated C-terminal domain-containing protein [Chitinophaga sp. Cy-1792]|uniref:T9SS type B sorting domain-containing protein n=1 Tax=Chitinophaga sp. Cy-1792 TaxID=2608339 RepID=UPI00141EE67C|nr:gliding motility-associated C-terminal domain-containing protein [Chitinophaga sp. Cy-1792]NIG56427.1 DUF11 domain-containing protein [Chitinophaga sp. Cy-1792]
MTKKTFLAIKYWLTAILLLCCITGLQAQSGTYKNTTGVNGDASLGAVPVSDISFANYQFPMIGIALAASTPAIQSDGSYNITYTYTLKNYGGIALTGVQVASDLSATFGAPMSFTIKSIGGSGISSNSSFTGTGTGGKQLLASGATLAAGASATVTVVINLKNNHIYGTFNANATATATAGTGTVSDVSANGTNPDANGNGVPMDDSAPTPVTISPAEIGVTKTTPTLTPFVGDNVTFTINAKNSGGDAVNVIITELPDNGFTFVSATPSVGTYNSATKTWTIPQFNANANATLTYVMTVNATGPYSNKASSNYPDDPAPGNNESTITLTPKPSADVQIVKTVDKNNPDVWTTVTYTLKATNAGPSDAANTVVTDKLPTGIEPASPLPSGMTYDAPTRTFTWNLGTMTAGTSQSQTIIATVQADIDRANFTNTAKISTTDHDPKTSNNSSSVTITPKEAVDLQVTKDLVTTTDPLHPLDPVSFVIKVKNLGPNNCYDANVTDLLTTGYSFVSASIPQGTYTPGTGVWNIGTLLKDQEVTMTIKAIITAKVDYGNTATTSTTDNDNNPGNNTASIATPTVRPLTDLQVTITPNGTQEVGNNISFDVVVKNNGPSPATTVRLDNVLLPAGYTFVSKSQAGYNSSLGTWDIGDLAAGNSVTLTLVGTLLPNAASYDLNAHVSGLEDEVTLTNNTASTSMAVKQVADLAITKTVDNSAPEVGQTVNFTITVNNIGPSAASNVVVTETSPNGYIFNTITPSVGTYSNGTWTIGTLAKGASVTLKINATVLPNGTYTNTASVTTTDKDPKTSNNSASVTPGVVQLADLSVKKDINNMNPDAGSNVQFTLTASNAGPSNATGVKVTDLLPTGYAFVSASPTGKYNSTTGIWTIGTLNVGQSTTLTISATVKPTGVYKNTATISAGQKDPDPSNNSDYKDPVVRPVADLQITKTVSNATPDEGTDVVYRLVAQNLGVSDATNVVVTDLLPSGVTYKPTAASAAYDKNTGTWNIGALAASSSKTLDITVTVNPNSGGNAILNLARIGGTEYDPVDANNTSQVSFVPAPVADLAITKTVDNTTPDVGSTVTFTLTAQNKGVSNATGVYVTDALPGGYTLKTATTATGTISGSTWTIGNMSVGATATATITAVVNASGTYTNTATIKGNEADRDNSNNTGSVTPVPVRVANLSVTKTISNDNPYAGSTVTFTITVTNAGPSAANATSVTEKLLSGYEFISASTLTGMYNNITGIWAIGTINNGVTATLTITAKVLPTGDYNNQAVVSSSVKDNDPSDNTAPIVPPVVRPVTDLTLTKTVDKSTTDAGTQVTFTLVAVNNGPSAATNVVVNDPLPTGFKFISADPGYDATTGIWTIGNLASGIPQTLTITVLVNPEGDYTNTAVISGQEYDPNTGNNTGTATVTRTAVADLEVIKTVDKATPDAGSNVTFTITAINHGASKATGVTVTDILQDGYDYVSDGPSVGTYSNGIWTIGDMEIGGNATLKITAKVKATGNYHNEATITGNEIDRVPANNYRDVTPVPVPVADLSVTKTISNASPDAGSNVTFTITANNAGPSEADNVTVTDILQDGYEFIAATPSVGTYNNTTGVWTIGTMTNGQNNTLTIVAKVLPTGNYNNTATITSPVKDIDLTNNTAPIVPPVVRPVTDLTLTKSVDKSTTDAGTQVTFTLVAGNSGPSDATNVVVDDPLPTGFKFISTSGTYDETTGKWTIGNLASGIPQTLTITVLVNPEGDYTNTAVISGQEYDPNTGNNTGTATVTRTAVADLEVIKTVDKATPDAGSNVTFTITAINHGASKATGVTVTDILQDGYDYVSDAPSVGTYTSGVWTIGDMEIGGFATMTIVAKVKATGNYHNEATIKGNEIDRVPANNYRDVTPVPVPVADLSVTKAISNDKPDAGSNVTFTITANNAGPSEADNVTVTDILQDGYEFIAATPSVGTYNNTTGVWTIGTMANGQKTTLTIEAKVLPTGNYNNTATITSPVKDIDLTNNTAPIVPPVVRPVTDLTLTKTVDQSTTDAGTQVTFTLIAGNKGPSDATNVVVNDPLPTGFKFISTSGAYDETTGKWTIGNLASGISQTLTITVLVNPEGDYTNTAVISGQEYDPNNGNNTGTATVTRTAVADLEVTKTVDNNTPDVGTNVTFTITATNHGASKATGVTVTDVLPDGYDYVSDAPSVGTYTTGVWTIGDMEIGGFATMTIVAKVKATGNYHNEATIKGNEIDRVPANNYRDVTPVPVPVADLSVTKAISNDKPDAGSNVTFTITANNAGPSEADNVTVTDILQDGYEFIAATPSVGTYNNTTGVWTIGTMANGQKNTLTIEAKVLPTGNYNNTATITSPVKDIDLTNNTAPIVPPVVRPVTDLTLTKTVDKSTTDAGTQVTFTLIAGNKGPSDATNVVVDDPLPTGFKFISTSGAYDETTGKWTIGNLASGISQTLTITVLVNPEGDYTNIAVISGQEYDPNTGNNTGTATVTRTAVADLEVTKTVDNNTPDVGTNVTFTITATNHGASKATGVTVTDVLPDGYDYVSDAPTVGTYTSGVWTIGNMDIDGSATMKITAKVRATGNYKNLATIAGIEIDRDLTNNTRDVTPIPVPVANLSVTKTISNATPDAGSEVTFTITATNAGPSDATGVTVTDILQDGYKLPKAVSSIGTYDINTGIWTIGTLANGQSATLTITATVQPSGNYNNTATIKGNEKDKTPGDDASSIVPPVPVPVADLSIIKTISNNVPGTGDLVSFKVVVKNNGPSTATNVSVTDVMQSGFTYQQSDVDKGSFTSSNGIWTIGTLAAGETATLQVDAWVNTTGIYINTATVKGTEKDPDLTNNSQEVKITPDPIADLHVSKTVSNMAPPHGSDVTFTVVAGNDGPSDATGVTVTDILPQGYDHPKATTSTGSYDPATGIWTIGNMAKGATATMTITVTVNKTGPYTNTAVIKGNETDRNTANNTASVTPVPVPLHTNDDAASTEEPDPVTIDVVKNDVYGNTGHTVFIKDKPLHGTVTDNGDGTVTYTPDAGFGGTDYFTYYIQDQSGFASNVSTVTIDVTKRLVDLSIKKVIVTPPAEIAVGKNVTFELTVTNNSRKGASGVVVTDILANNVGDSEIKTQTDNGKEGYDPVSKTMSWKIDTLAPGQTVKLLVTAKLLSGGQVNNTATVAGKNSDPDPDNNTATVSAPVKGADIFVPTAFTPNGDGINDKFVILGIDRYPNSQLIIWNRWGNVVYRSNDYRNGWDGSGLNEGTYYYELICPSNDGKISLKGWVQLVR